MMHAYGSYPWMCSLVSANGNRHIRQERQDMTLAQSILLDSLALADAVWWPIRTPGAPSWAAVWALRDRYRTQGVAYRGGGSKEHERALAEAVETGWLSRRRAARKTIGVRLTRDGLVEGWRLLGLGPFSDLVVAMELDRHSPPGAWVPEICLSDGLGWGDGREEELKIVERVNLPALTSGLVESNSTVRGHVAYRTTRAGRPAAPAGELDQPDPESEPAAWEHYSRALRESLMWLDSQTAESVNARGEIGQIPLATHEIVRARLT